MAIPGDVQAALDRLVQYNSNPVSNANPYGLANYGNIVNFPLALSDVETVAGWFGETGGLPGPKGDPGDDGSNGREIQLQKSATHLQWRYVGDAAWSNIVALADITGPKGDTGDKGDKGDKGDSFTVDAVGLLSGRAAYDGQAVGFSYLATDNSLIYFRAAGGGWTAGVPFGKGDKGDTGAPGTTDYLALTNLPTLGTAAAKNTGTGAGQVPLLDAGGKLDTSVLPALAINDIFVVNNQTAMLALTAQRGDVAVRSDVNKTFILSADTPATLSAWVELPVPANAVLSVAGLTGAITASALKAALALVAADVGITIATASELRTGTAGKYLDAAVIYSANAPVALVDGATITPDFAAGRNFTVTLGGNRALANPSNQVAGQSGVIIIKQDGTGNRTLSWGSAFKFAGGAPTLSTAANSVDSVAYYVEAAGTIRCTFQKGYA